MKKSPFRICVISFPMASWWVVNVFLSDLLKLLEPVADEIYVITKDYNFATLNKKVCVYDTKLHLHFRVGNKFKLISLLYQLFKIILIQIIMCCYLIKIVDRTNIIIFYVGNINLLLPTLVAKVFRKKVILFAMGRGPSMSGVSPKITRSVAINSIFKIIIDFLFKSLYKLSDKIVLETEKELSFLGFEDYEARIDSRGARYVDTDIFTIKKRIDERKNIIGFLSRLNKEKGIVNLVEAVPLLSNLIRNMDENIEVKIYGDGPLKKKIMRIIEENELNRFIELKGWIPSHNTVASALNDFKLLVLPSNVEGLPTIILEAMACGTPVLATPVGSIPNVIKDGETGFIMDDNSPECIARNMIRSLEHPNLDEIVKNARELVEKEYCYEAAVRRYEQILREI